MIEKVKGNVHVCEFGSISEFVKYISDTPTNNVFKYKELQSQRADGGMERFSKTKSFAEASELLKNGWTEQAEKLNQRINANKAFRQDTCRKTVTSVAGYQAIVPAYLMGMPNSMVATKLVAQKNKIVTINKSINYSVRVKADEIVEESVKALRIVQKLEAQGFRVNLNIIFAVHDWSDNVVCVKIKIKNANERLNISKVAFPLIHPSMLRRLLLRFEEVYPKTPQSFTRGYGHPCKKERLDSILNCFGYKNECVLPAFFTKNVDEIVSFADLK